MNMAELEERIEYLRSDPEVLDDVKQFGDKPLSEISVTGFYKMLELIGDVETPMLSFLYDGTLSAEWRCADIDLVIDIFSKDQIAYAFIQLAPEKQKESADPGKMETLIAELENHGVFDFLRGDACAKYTAAWKQGRDLRDEHAPVGDQTEPKRGEKP